TRPPNSFPKCDWSHGRHPITDQGLLDAGGPQTAGERRMVGKFRIFGPGSVDLKGPVSARQFSISVSACRRPVRHVTETGSRKGAHVAARFLAQFRADRTEDRLQSIA